MINARTDPLQDIKVNASVELARTHVSLDEALALEQDSVLGLDRLAGEPVEVRLNGRLFAHGEVVVAEGLADIEIDCVFELGRKSITLDQARDIRPECVILISAGPFTMGGGDDGPAARLVDLPAFLISPFPVTQPGLSRIRQCHQSPHTPTLAPTVVTSSGEKYDSMICLRHEGDAWFTRRIQCDFRLGAGSYVSE
jgi:flagellar motor switch protein FliN